MDKGVVSVFGGMPGDRKIGIPGKRIGYMPQVITNWLPIINIDHKFESINLTIPGICFVQRIYNKWNSALLWKNSWHEEVKYL